ncbi:4-amino-4-deoxy-L-arabinose transferase-like glycosyltransferase [Arthrobacter silviterrae]|uniref:GerMN domain-containing protein n=1 Tax=Arthrobacter silviterrae TaxID=2026658 RepID=A0ABX0DG88_9MICC|nr:hypothetical protein [Arthrobacter silviterrae]MDQ0278134.1 4-amino-4-deoxy-L-arabinose transferase-like glycosyltransferase [Arthrobacter silviterrae]NGN84400.1 hypothetical protein [Arthrobacter silviterrae]
MFRTRHTPHPWLALLAGSAIALAGCTGTPAGPAASGTPTGGGGTGHSQATASSTAAATQGTSAMAPVPPTATDEPTVLPTTASVTLFYIAQGDGGASGPLVGCGDSAVAVTSASISYTDPVEGALRALLSDHSRQLGQSGLDNALWQSQLSVESVDRSGPAVTAHLTGTLAMGGECDIPRVEQQLLLTAKQAAGTPVAITINGKTLKDALSLK